MATTEEIITAAQALGELIAEHAAAKKYDEAVARIQKDIEAQRVLTDYQRCIQRLTEKESAGQPIEVSDKRQFEALQQQIIRNLTLQQFQMAQMDYLDLMRKVDEVIAGDKAEALGMTDHDGGQGGGGPAGPGLVIPGM